MEPASAASAPAPAARHQRRLPDTGGGSLYGDLPPADGAASPPAASGHSTFAFSLGSKLGIGVNPAPEVEERAAEPEVSPTAPSQSVRRLLHAADRLTRISATIC